MIKAKKAVVAVVAAVLAEWTAGTARANFTLVGSQELTVNTVHAEGWVCHQSKAWIATGGSVSYLYAYDTSTANICGGTACLLAYHTSTVNISSGSVPSISAYDTSTMNISGGTVIDLRAYNASTITVNARDIGVHGGLSLNGDKVVGTGILSGKWFDGTAWAVNISQNDASATIRVVPEPATLSLLALGGLALIRRHSGRTRGQQAVCLCVPGKPD